MKKKLVFGSLLLSAVIIVSLLLYFNSDYYLLKTGIYDNSYLKAYDIVKSKALIGKTPAECYDILISSNALVFDEKIEPDILNDTEKKHFNIMEQKYNCLCKDKLQCWLRNRLERP